MRPSTTHGTAAMASTGCRCLHCDRARERIPHGTPGGYHNWRCRCDDCCDAGRAEQNARARLRRGAKAETKQQDHGWMKEAACVTARPADVPLNQFVKWFVPAVTETGREPRRAYDKARPYCAMCPVVDVCLEHALDTREPLGLRGGKTPPEREYLLRTRRRAS